MAAAYRWRERRPLAPPWNPRYNEAAPIMPAPPRSPLYIPTHPWQRERPRCLVVACSDGRLQAAVDEFLDHVLRVRHYDRLYLPGGPGALVSSGVELVRPTLCRQELRFLIDVHEVEHAILLFHGPAEGGPDAAICADYRRKLGGASAAEIRARQERDALEIIAQEIGTRHRPRVDIFRCEVRSDGAIAFVSLASSGERGG